MHLILLYFLILIATSCIIEAKKYIESLAGRVPAFVTESVHNNMFKVNLKTTLLQQHSFQRFEDVLLTFYGFTALAAYQVVMMSFFCMVIDSVIHRLTFIDTPGLFQEFQCAINGRLVDTGELSMNMVYYFFGGEMLSLVMDIVQNYPARSGQP